MPAQASQFVAINLTVNMYVDLNNLLLYCMLRDPCNINYVEHEQT